MTRGRRKISGSGGQGVRILRQRGLGITDQAYLRGARGPGDRFHRHSRESDSPDPRFAVQRWNRRVGHRFQFRWTRTLEIHQDATTLRRSCYARFPRNRHRLATRRVTTTALFAKPGTVKSMPSSQNGSANASDKIAQPNETFAPLSARRLLLLGGIGLILVGMIFGDIFAVFVLHQNASRVGASLAAASHAAFAGDRAAVANYFRDVGGFLENRGTKVDTHAHMIAFGYLALMLSLLAPWTALSDATKRRLASLFLCGAGLLPLCVFLIHYVGLAYSPLKSIG